MAKVKRDPYSRENILKHRTFPVGKAIGAAILITIQVLLILFAVLYDPKPQDRIERYEITAAPCSDGSIDITYDLTWLALDTDEELTWIEIGMPNKHFDFYQGSFSHNISSYEKYIEDGYVSARLYLDRAYQGGERLSFSFKINQREMLMANGNGYFYELVPGWFNATPVEEYRFIWKSSPNMISTNADSIVGGDAVWSGAMECGEYVSMTVEYNGQAFPSAYTVEYEEFDGSAAYDQLESDKGGVIAMSVIFSVLILFAEIYMIDSFVSYHRGRGFLRGYGYHVHIYGRTNPKYEKEVEKHSSSGGRSHGGGGCACACACACAGGGRAGCSQKDTFSFKRTKRDESTH